MQPTSVNLLVVEDSAFHFKCISRELERTELDCHLKQAVSIAEAQAAIHETKTPFDLILLDLNIADSRGLATLHAMQAASSVPIVVLTGDSKDESAIAAARMGAQDFLVKGPKLGPSLRKAILFAISRQQTIDHLQTNVEVLSRVAYLDPLTGISNRRCMDETLQSLWQQFQTAGDDFAIVLIDLDHFGKINNNYGHQAGDDVLRKVAITLAEVAGSDDVACRYGGEEFCLILKGTDQASGLDVGDYVRQRIADLLIQSNDDLIEVTASIGVTAAHCSMSTCEEMLEVADKALYEAKITRDTVVGSPLPVA